MKVWIRLLLVLLAIGFAAPALADRTSGTWTGLVDLRGNYYWERSTRVIAPAATLRLDSPSGIRIGADYLIDSITSASQAAGATTDVRFTELRHEGNFNMGYEFDLGDTHLDLSGSLRVSREPDYLSLGAGLNLTLSLNERSTLLSLGLSYLHDEIRQRPRAGSRISPQTAGGTTAASFAENFDALSTTLSWEQTLSPSAYFRLSYQYVYLNGFLANAYRRVGVNGTLLNESHPRIRHRHTLTGHLAYHIRASRTSLHAIYRAYIDNWSIGALTPEVRVYQQLGEEVTARVRWRHYRQTRAFFYQDAYDTGTPEDAYVTADPKMSKFHNHLLGVQLILGLGFLETSFLDALRKASISLSFDYLWNTNRFGNGIIGQAELAVPF